MKFKVVLEYDPDDQCWVTYVPALDNISTWGQTKEEALRNTEEAIIGYLEAARKTGQPLPVCKPIEIAEVVVAG
ncbi:type II toxin-antitoxin system HicB family antitoxin [Candidatus Desulforudis audaxviator]|nr:type II toxin-antitoxin system HicB family antitoxin [Candidatus Desulforudis audaxviator]AZK60681.1 Hypothetical protein Daudx_2152 [Candidatus Desulforudis audaxviator]